MSNEELLRQAINRAEDKVFRLAESQGIEDGMSMDFAQWFVESFIACMGEFSVLAVDQTTTNRVDLP